MRIVMPSIGAMGLLLRVAVVNLAGKLGEGRLSMCTVGAQLIQLLDERGIGIGSATSVVVLRSVGHGRLLWVPRGRAATRQ
jgi:hypothetical protein